MQFFLSLVFPFGLLFSCNTSRQRKKKKKEEEEKDEDEEGGEEERKGLSFPSIKAMKIMKTLFYIIKKISIIFGK